ncbi:MAG: hypothetical protein JWN99_1413, partial [Ilumatobacteraceae bacterium]|nr:hypothetical protein [Ilumatobacteraceae bacterium]
NSGFVGREVQLAQLDGALMRSQAAAEVVVVTGEPGVGVSSLLTEWSSRARARGVLVLAGRARAGVDLALHPIIDALDDLTRSSAQMAVGPEGVHGIEGVGLTPPQRGAADAALQRAMFDDIERLIGAVRPTSGVAVVIDDAHAADAVTIAWLAHVSNHRNEHRLLVVVAIAETEAGLVSSSATIRVQPLDRDEAALLVGADRVDQLWTSTNGNPLLLVELAGAGADGSIPTTIREAVAERLRSAGQSAVSLRAAAVLGPTIDLDLLSGVLGRSPLELLDELDDGVRRSFLIEHDGNLAFRHELVRQAAASEANVARRMFLHREAARWLAARPAAETVTDALEIARHARAGGDAATAAHFLMVAARLAGDRVDLTGAESLLDDAIELHDAAAARLARSRVRMARGDLAGADDDASAALGLGAGAEALELRAWAARNRHDMDAAIRLGRAGAAASTDAQTTASCLMAVAFAHRGVGDLHATDALLGEASALNLARNQSLDAWTGVLRVHQGRPDEALAALEPLLGSVPSDLHSFWVEHVLQMTAHAYGSIGRVADAFTVLDRLDVELVRRGTTVRYAGLSDTYRSWLLRALASPEAADVARRAIEHAATSEIRGQAHLDLADALERAGDLDHAADAMRAALVEMGTRWFHNRWRCEQRAGLIEARLRLAADDAVESIDLASSVATAAQERGDLRYASMARVQVALARLRSGQPVDAEASLADIGIVARVAAPEAWRLAADLADALGDDRGGASARRLAGDVGSFLAGEAGDRGQHLKRVLAARLA